MSLCLRPLRLRCPRRIRTAAGCRAGRLPARRQPAAIAAANSARAARRDGLSDRSHAPGRPRHDAPRPAARECGICLPCPPRIPVDTCAARFRLPERGAALCRRGRGARQLAGGFLPALRPARGALPRHPRGDRLREPEYRGRRRGASTTPPAKRPTRALPSRCGSIWPPVRGFRCCWSTPCARRESRRVSPGLPRGTTTAATTAGSRYGSAAAGISRNITPRGSTMPGSFRMPGGRSTTVRTASSPCRSGRPATGFRWCGARTRVRCTGSMSRSVTATSMHPTNRPSWRREGIRR